jgi:hypothetical protein
METATTTIKTGKNGLVHRKNIPVCLLFIGFNICIVLFQ